MEKNQIPVSVELSPKPTTFVGTEERLTFGYVLYMPPGRTAIVEKDLKFLDFSPEKMAE